MKKINIFTVVEVYNTFSNEEFNDYVNVYDLKMKSREIECLKNLVHFLNLSSKDKRIFENYFIGYNIPQIGKEFDLIRLGKEKIVNIELKSESSVETIKKQLLKNKYFMNHINKEILYFSYVLDVSKLFILDKNNNLEEVEFDYLIKILSEQEQDFTDYPDKYFEPSSYLVSPFNSTEKFLGNEYFLTNQQEFFRSDIIEKIKNSKKCQFFLVSGNAGTGKTLLVYNIANYVKDLKKVLIIHCANLNNGQEVLKSRGWNIVSIKEFYRAHETYINTNEVFIVDEAQRLRKDQYEKIAYSMKDHNCCLFSYDQKQTLSMGEKVTNIEECLIGLKSENKYKLTEKIRANESVANFILSLFNLRYGNRKLKSKESIDLMYFSTNEKAKCYITSISSLEWTVLRMTPRLYGRDSHQADYMSTFMESHKVIGQEFDNVAVIIDRSFSYENNKLIYFGKSYYDADRMLFQNMTRARKKLKLIFVNNRTVFKEALKIIKN